jgi:hypothetical protein
MHITVVWESSDPFAKFDWKRNGDGTSELKKDFNSLAQGTIPINQVIESQI